MIFPLGNWLVTLVRGLSIYKWVITTIINHLFSGMVPKAHHNVPQLLVDLLKIYHVFVYHKP
jgi:hypothetical protein